jgi:DNA-binding NtrC family response regulator
VEFTAALAERMRARGLEVDTADNGALAVEKARARTFDAIVLDFAMPGMNGIETLQALLETNPDLQIILLTGQGTVQTAVEATKLGAMDFLEKPTDIDTLLAKIRKARSKRLELAEQRTESEIEDILSRRGW